MCVKLEVASVLISPPYMEKWRILLWDKVILSFDSCESSLCKSIQALGLQSWRNYNQLYLIQVCGELL